MIHLRDYQISQFLRSARMGIVMQDSVAMIQNPRGVGEAEITIAKLLGGIVEKVPKPLQKMKVSSLVWDSRQVIEGSVFFAISGEKTDGNTFIPEALQKGAIAVLTDKPSKGREHTNVFIVENVRKTLAVLAKRFYRSPDEELNVIGVTGTNGKTTVTRMMKHLLEQDAKKCGLIGTIEYQLGDRVLPAKRTTPESDEVFALMREMVSEDCLSAVMEVSSHGLEQHRVDGVTFDTVVFLNLTPEHLDYHRSMEEYFKAKRKLFSGDIGSRPKNAVINVDCEFGRRLVEELSGSEMKVITYSIDGDADFVAKKVACGPKGLSFQLNGPEGSQKVNSELMGCFNVENTLAALAAGYACGLSQMRMVSHMKSMDCVPGRMQKIEEGQDFLVLVDYAHTADALERALQNAKSLTAQKLHVVFGCGGDRDRSKRSLMMASACNVADFVWATSDNPRTEKQERIFDDMLSGMDPKTAVRFVKDRENAIRGCIAKAGTGDTVLIAGKGHETYQEVNGTMIPFDDREVSKRVLREILNNPKS